MCESHHIPAIQPFGEGFRATVENETQLQQFAVAFGVGLCAGDRVGIQGELGAGKTAFCRSIIRALVNDPAAIVPSPTFSYLHTYATAFGVLLHADAFRMADDSGPAEVDLEPAEDHILLLEWPERIDARVTCSLHLSIACLPDRPQARELRFFVTDTSWQSRLSRLWLRWNTLSRWGWARAWRQPLAGDASPRAYERLSRSDGRRAILLDARPRADRIVPAKLQSRLKKMARVPPENIVSVCAINAALRALDLASPAVLEADGENRFLLLEDLGGETIGDSIRGPIPERYAVAIDVLATLHLRQPIWPAEIRGQLGPHALASWNENVAFAELEQFLEFFRIGDDQALNLSATQLDRFRQIWRDVLPDSLQEREALVLLDYHSPNLIWREDESGLRRVGLIDTQNALRGPAAYDVATLVQDARIRIPEALEADLLARYRATRGMTAAEWTCFADQVRILATQRALRLLGQFVRLAEIEGKRSYLPLLHLQKEYLARNLRSSRLQALADWLKETVPGALHIAVQG